MDWKNNNYNSIFVIIDCPIKMIFYKPVKVTINADRLTKVVINVVIRYQSYPGSLISN